MSNITNLTMDKIVIENCKIIENNFSDIDHDSWIFRRNGMILFCCYNVQLQNITVRRSDGDQLYRPAILAINLLGISSFINITSYGINVMYDEMDVDYKYNKILIENYQILSSPKYLNIDIGITIYLYQESYKVEIEIYNTKFATINSISGLFEVIQTANTFGNFIHLNQCIVEQITGDHFFYSTSSMWFHKRHVHHQITFTSCIFRYNKFLRLLTVHGEANIELVGCTFEYINVRSELIKMSSEFSHQNSMVIVNTSFYLITTNFDLIHISNVLLNLKGAAIFSKLKADRILNTIHSTVSCHKYIEFSENIVTFTDNIDYIIVQENTLINMTNNVYSTINEINQHYYDAHSVTNLTAPCYYQYTAERQNFDNHLETLNFSIVFHNDISIHTLMTAHCRWVHGSAFNNARPIDINKRLIKSDFPLYYKLVCYCFQENSQDCSIDTLATVFPGQTISLSLVLNYNYPTFTHHLTGVDTNYSHIVTIEINDDVLPETACKVAKVSEVIQEVHYSTCTIINLTIVHNGPRYLRWCELFINILSTHQVDVYYIDISPCPAGFIYQNGICICDPVLNLPHVILIIKLFYDLLVVGYLLSPSMTHTNIASVLGVHYTIVYLNQRDSISPFLTHSVNLTGPVCCVDSVNKVSVLSLVIPIVNTALIYTCSLLYQ